MKHLLMVDLGCRGLSASLPMSSNAFIMGGKVACFTWPNKL